MHSTPRTISVGLSYMYEPAFNKAILPLLESGSVDGLEWSFDTVSDYRLLPDWQQSLLKAYSAEGQLYGHGVYFSLFGSNEAERHRQWLDRLQSVQETFAFRHLSEHFGFMTSGNAHSGCPLPVPLNQAALQLGQNRLAAIRQRTSVPIGVENLALVFCAEDALQQGDFVRQLVTPGGDFVLLDLHNLYCQAYNFDLDLKTLVHSYPLDRVRELHLSGGSWARSAFGDRDVRRDTHDDAVPEEILDVLPYVVDRCPHLDLVVLERLGDTLNSEADCRQFAEEFRAIKSAVTTTAGQRPVPDWPFQPLSGLSEHHGESDDLIRQQQSILRVLAQSANAAEARQKLVNDPKLQEWQTCNWHLAMIETAMQLGKKWGIEIAP